MLNNNDMQQLEKLMETNSELNSLISKVMETYKFNICKFSHELRNPITLVNSSLQLIESQHPEVKTFKFWNETMADIQYVRSLLDELSSFNQSNTLNMSQFSINELMDSVCSSIRNDMIDTSFKLTCTYHNSLPIVTGDAVKMRQVITNLLKNAKDAVDPNNGSIDVSVQTLDNHSILIAIADNGCGIPPEHQDTIFEPFVTHKTNGSGLGLSICQNIIEAHHGTIRFESEINKGTTFYIKIPTSQDK
jgi:signal transduction histidine kinase